MSRSVGIRICGWIGLCFSILLAAATVWAYSSYRATFGSIAKSLHDTVQSASTVLDQITTTTKARVDVAEDTIQLLRSTRKLVQDLKASSEKQGILLPQYAANMKDAASSMYEFAGAAIVVANTLSVSLPTGFQMNGVMPTIVWGRPLEAPAQSLRTLAQRGASLGVSLDAVSASLSGEARTITASFVDSCNQTLKLIDDLEKMATAVKAEHLPQVLSAMEHLKETFRQVNSQAEMVDQLGIALVSIGMLLAFASGTLSFGMLRIATALEGGKT